MKCNTDGCPNHAKHRRFLPNPGDSLCLCDPCMLEDKYNGKFHVMTPADIVEEELSETAFQNFIVQMRERPFFKKKI